MKKVIIAIVALFIGAAAANAQIGIMAGLTSSSSNVEAAFSDIGNVNQFHVGVAYKLGLGNLLAIQPALIYNVKGTSIEDIAEISDLSVDFKTGYIEVPVQVQVGFGVGSLARVYGFVEPFIGLAVSNKVTSSVSDSATSTWDNVANRLEYGVALGAGVEVFRHLQVAVKYFWNLGNVYGGDIEFSSLYSATIGGSKCNGVALSVVFLF